MYALSGVLNVPVDPSSSGDLARAWTNLASIANTVE